MTTSLSSPVPPYRVVARAGLGCLAVLASVTLAGCSIGARYESPESAPSPPATSRPSAPSTPAESAGGSGSGGSVEPAPGTIAAADDTRTYDCGGREVTVAGSGNTLHLVGDCPSLDVTGSRNTIRVDQLGEMQLFGYDNDVTWVAGISGEPQVSDRGFSNTVQKDD